jgi:hypothetical protein
VTPCGNVTARRERSVFGSQGQHTGLDRLRGEFGEGDRVEWVGGGPCPGCLDDQRPCRKRLRGLLELLAAGFAGSQRSARDGTGLSAGRRNRRLPMMLLFSKPIG